MKLAIISDIHYGESENYGKINPETKLNTRLEDIHRTFNRYIDYVLDPKREIDVAIIAGDIYKSRKPTPTQQLLFTSSLVRLLEYNKTAEKKIEVVVFTGNHDIQRDEEAHSVSSVEQLLKVFASNFIVSNEPRNYIFERDDEKVLLCTIPYLYRQKLGMASNDQVVEFYKTIIAEALRLGSDATCKVFAGHQTVEGCSITEYADLNSFNEIIVPLNAFSGFDFVSQGHIHKYQVVQAESPCIVHQGNPVQLEFDEVSDKGFIVFDTKTKVHKRVIINGIKFVRIDVDTADTDQDATAEILKVLEAKKEQIKNAIVKIRVTIKTQDLPIRVAEFKELLKEARFVAALEKTIKKKGRSRSEKVTRENTPETILREVAKVRGYTPEQTEEYVKVGIPLTV
jgi:exonuclease SbcD